MDGNKDEAARCIKIAKSALASGDKQRVLKFIRIARRLDHSLPLDDLLVACENLDGSDAVNRQEKVAADRVREEPSCSKAAETADEGHNYTEDHVRLIRQIKMTKDYYAVLGVEKNCSVEEIRKAYRKLSLKVHPDKNKAPGAEEAFKSVCKAFKCLSDEQLRRNYDQIGVAEDSEYNLQNVNMRRRRRRRTTKNDFLEEDFDPDEIFRSFFFGTQGNAFNTQRAYRARRMGQHFREHNVQGGGGGFSFIALFQILPILLFFLFLCFPFPEPHYSLQKTRVYQIPKVTAKDGVQYFVKSADFEQQFPLGSSSRETLEYNVFRDYRSILSRYCRIELQRRQWSRTYPTPYCDKLRNLQEINHPSGFLVTLQGSWRFLQVNTIYSSIATPTV
ncbi:unnamed protein product [Musa textilis]